MKSAEMDPRITLKDQLTDPTSDPVILINFYDVDPANAEAFKIAWEKVSKAQPNFLSAQLHQGTCGSRTFMNYSVFESTAAFKATALSPDFKTVGEAYPEGVTARPHLFRHVAIPGICIGQV